MSALRQATDAWNGMSTNEATARCRDSADDGAPSTPRQAPTHGSCSKRDLPDICVLVAPRRAHIDGQHPSIVDKLRVARAFQCANQERRSQCADRILQLEVIVLAAVAAPSPRAQNASPGCPAETSKLTQRRRWVWSGGVNRINED